MLVIFSPNLFFFRSRKIQKIHEIKKVKLGLSNCSIESTSFEYLTQIDEKKGDTME